MTDGTIADKFEKSDLLYETLKVAYDRVLDRRKTLTGQASSLLTLGGIINTILVGLIIPLSTNSGARALLGQNPNHMAIVSTIEAGFFLYILMALFAIFAFIEPKWHSAPEPLSGETVSAQKEALLQIYSNPSLFNVSNLDLQLINATSRNQETNKRKYRFLIVGYALLFLGILVTAIAGYFLISGISFG